jgi:chemotaxis protein histidine kinase CheA
LMGGGIAVTSEVGHGSVFSICVPANICGSTESAVLATGQLTGVPELALAR